MNIPDLCRAQDISVQAAEKALANLQERGIVTGYIPGNMHAEITVTGKAALYRPEESAQVPPVPNSILVRLRQREGMMPNDPSRDTELQQMPPMDKLRAVCAWELGDPLWADDVMQWAKDCHAVPTAPERTSELVSAEVLSNALIDILGAFKGDKELSDERFAEITALTQGKVMPQPELKVPYAPLQDCPQNPRADTASPQP